MDFDPVPGVIEDQWIENTTLVVHCMTDITKDRYINIKPGDPLAYIWFPENTKLQYDPTFKDKRFIWLGDTDKITLFGQNLWRDGGKMVIVTEGEIDALSVSAVQQNKWPVVSVPSGATSAKKFIKKELQYLSKFSSIILMFILVL